MDAIFADDLGLHVNLHVDVRELGDNRARQQQVARCARAAGTTKSAVPGFSSFQMPVVAEFHHVASPLPMGLSS